VSWNIM